jgi:hypothetical protein
MIDYNNILRCVAASPEAREQLTAALVYSEHGIHDLMRLHAAAAADILVAKHPDLGDPIRLCAVLVAALLQDERNRQTALLN